MSEATRPLYGIDERPRSWWESLLYGWQHTLVDISPFVLPLAVAAALGMSDAETARFINFGLVAMGVATLLQTTVGNRLPIVQGPSATLTGTLAPLAGQLGPGPMWGAVMAGGLVEMVVGAARLPGLLRRFLPPAVSGVVIITIGLSLGQLAVRLAVGDGRTLNLVLAATVLALVMVLQLACSRVLGGILARGAVFFTIWVVGLGLGGALGEVDWAVVAARPWFSLPALFPYGGPGFGWTFPVAAVLVVLAGYFGSLVESLGDYAATCTVAGVPYTERHMNRGVFAEGLGCVLASIFGGLPCTSYTQNIGIIATTGVASRFVVRIAGGVLLLYGLCPKFGALLVALPRSVLGGVFILVCGMIVISGIRLVQAAEASSANAFVVGTTLVIATTLPPYVRTALGADWLAGLPSLVSLLLTNSVVLAVLVGVGLNWVLVHLLPPQPSPGQ